MWLPKILGSRIFIATFRRENKPPVLPGEEKSFSMSKVPGSVKIYAQNCLQAPAE